jgi:hypothetical protein
MPYASIVDRVRGRQRTEALGFCFNLFSEEPAHTGEAEPKGLFAFRDRQGALADGLNGLNPRNTTGVRFTLHDRGGLSERDRRKLGPSGESNAQPIESLPLGALGGVLMAVHCVCVVAFRPFYSMQTMRHCTAFKASLGEGRSSGITLARTMEKR